MELIGKTETDASDNKNPLWKIIPHLSFGLITAYTSCLELEGVKHHASADRSLSSVV